MNDLWKWTRMMLEIRRLLNRNIREGKKGKTKSMIPTLNGCVLCVHAKNTYSSSQILFMMNSRTPNFKASNIGIKKHTHVFFFLHNFKRQNIAMLIVGCKLSLITLWYNYEDSKRFFFSHCCILVLIFKLHAFSSAGRSNNKKNTVKITVHSNRSIDFGYIAISWDIPPLFVLLAFRTNIRCVVVVVAAFLPSML